MAVIKGYILALVFVIIASSVQSAKEEDYPEAELPGIAVPDDSFDNKIRGADTPPCLPDQWQANITGQTVVSGGRDGGKITIINNVAIYVDQTNKQIAGKGDGGGRFHNKSGGFVFRVRGNITELFVFNFEEAKCFHKEIKNATFKPQCLPPNSTAQDITLGPATGGLQAKEWSYRARSPQGADGMRVYLCGTMILTNDNLPVTNENRGVIRRGRRPHPGDDVITFDQDDDDDANRRGRGGSIKFASSQTYKSARTPVQDPSVFTPPTYCNATVSAPRDTLFFDDDSLTDILERFVAF